MSVLGPVRIGGSTFMLDVATAAHVAALASTDPAAALALARRSHRAIVPPGGAIHTPLVLADAAPPLFHHSAPAGTIKMSGVSDMKTASINLADHGTVWGDERLVAEVKRLQGELRSKEGVIAALADQAVKNAPVPPVAPAARAPAVTMADAAFRSEARSAPSPARPESGAETARDKYVRGLATAYLPRDLRPSHG